MGMEPTTVTFAVKRGDYCAAAPRWPLKIIYNDAIINNIKLQFDDGSGDVNETTALTTL